MGQDGGAVDWAITLAVIAGVTGGIGWVRAWTYRRWWLDAVEQRDHARQTTRVLSRRLSAYRIRAAAQLAQLDPADSPDGPGGATPGPVEGA